MIIDDQIKCCQRVPFLPADPVKVAAHIHRVAAGGQRADPGEVGAGVPGSGQAGGRVQSSDEATGLSASAGEIAASIDRIPRSEKPTYIYSWLPRAYQIVLVDGSLESPSSPTTFT